MVTIPYHKLVRDRIPEIIEKSGKSCTCSTLDNDEYLRLLDEKLNEELAEYQADKSMEELADLLEVIRAVARARGSSIEEVESIRMRKAEERGGFEQRILLEEVSDPSDELLLCNIQIRWSVFVAGFTIPLDVQARIQLIPELAIIPG